MAALGLVLLVGCVDDLEPSTFVSRTRILAAQTSVNGDPTMAYPAPGDSARVDWLIGYPAEPLPISWGFLVCPSIVAPTGDFICVGDPFGLEVVSELTVGVDPSVEFTVPPNVDAQSLLVAGIVCTNGTPRLDMTGMDFGCEGDNPGLDQEVVVFNVPLNLDGDGNRNPSPGQILLNQATVVAPNDPVPVTGCQGSADPALTTISHATGNPMFTIQSDAAAFESYNANGSTETEEILYAVYTTAGEMERQFTVIEMPGLTDMLEWELPPLAEVPPNGQRVRFYIVVRDSRDGFAYTVRDVCLVP